MIRNLLLLTALLLGFHGQAQFAPLDFASYGIDADCSPDGNAMICSKAGEVAIFQRSTNCWKRVDPDSKESAIPPTYDNVDMWGSDTAILSGYFGNNDMVQRTTNGGKTWTKVRFGLSGWVDVSCHLDNGEVWLSVSGRGFAFSKDKGASWSTISTPDPKQRYTEIFFNAQHEGIIGSLWNSLWYTADNGAHWKQLPTPLDMGAYVRTNRKSRPEFSRVAIWGDHILVVQDGLVFSSNKNDIKWTLLNGYTDVNADPEGRTCFLRAGSRGFTELGTRMDTVRILPSVEPNALAWSRNGILFCLEPDALYGVAQGNRTRLADLTPPHEYPVGFAYDPNDLTEYGTKGRTVYLKKSDSTSWEKVCDLPEEDLENKVALSNAGGFNVFHGTDSIFGYDRFGSLQSRTTIPGMITSFLKSGLASITFSKGSSGCFHSFVDSKEFDHLSGRWVSLPLRVDGSQHKSLVDDEEMEFGPAMVDWFTSRLPDLVSMRREPVIADFGFTDRDLKRCRQNILAFQEWVSSKKQDRDPAFYMERNNIDFTRLASLVDSIATVTPATLREILMTGDGSWSTTRDHVSILLKNEAGQVMTFRSNYYISEKPFFLPWTIVFDGLSITTTSTDIYRFAQATYPGFLGQEDRIGLLQKIVKSLYLSQLN